MLKILNKGTISTRNNNSKNILTGKENTLKQTKKSKKVIYEEESDRETEEEESRYIPEETEEIGEPKIE